MSRSLKYPSKIKDEIVVLLNDLKYQINLLNEKEIILNKATDIEILIKKIKEENFNLAVLGQFKRGKSTIINYFLGKNLLPVSILPTTSIPTFINYDNKPKLIIKFYNNQNIMIDEENLFSEYLKKFVTEQNNPQNEKNVEYVKLFYPSSFLKKGVTIIDTPGIGSTFSHNTKTTESILNNCDAALFITSVDPPITESELTFLKNIKFKIKNLFFVLNKIDYLSSEEEINQIKNFYITILKENLNIDISNNLFCISAKNAIEYKLKNDYSLLKDTGIYKLENFLTKYFITKKNEDFLEVIKTKSILITKEILNNLSLIKSSTKMPEKELEKKINLFNSKIEETKEKRIYENDILEGEQKRLRELLEEYAVEIRTSSYEKFKNQIMEIIVNDINDLNSMESKIKKIFSNDIPFYFENKYIEISKFLNKKIYSIFNKYQVEYSKILNDLKKFASELFNSVYYISDNSLNLNLKHEPYWINSDWLSSFDGIKQNIFFIFFDKNFKINYIKKRVLKSIDKIILRNTENLRWSLWQNIILSFENFKDEVDKYYNTTLDSLLKAVNFSKILKVQQKVDIETKLNFIDKIEFNIKKIYRRIEEINV